MLTWPVLLKLHGDPELVFITDEDDWRTNPEITDAIFTEDDLIIDSAGQTFHWPIAHDHQTAQLLLSGTMGLQEITELIKAHHSHIGSCCIAKILFPSIATAIASVATQT